MFNGSCVCHIQLCLLGLDTALYIWYHLDTETEQMFDKFGGDTMKSVYTLEEFSKIIKESRFHTIAFCAEDQPD